MKTEEVKSESVSVVHFSWLTSGQIVLSIIWSPSTSCSWHQLCFPDLRVNTSTASTSENEYQRTHTYIVL